MLLFQFVRRLFSLVIRRKCRKGKYLIFFVLRLVMSVTVLAALSLLGIILKAVGLLLIKAVKRIIKKRREKKRSKLALQTETSA